MEKLRYERQSIVDITARNIMDTYARQPIVLDKGEGSYVWDIQGRKYLDFICGISVNNLGHRPKAVVDAVKDQIEKLWHTSNIYFTGPSALLAQALTEKTFADRVFFCNSGAEANEAAIKLVRKYAVKHKGESCKEIICMNRSFHGRTLATLSATGQEKVRAGFEPYLPGFRFADFGDMESLTRQLSPKTAAIMLEPIQAEGGVHVFPPGYLKELRQICDGEGLLLVLDEIQTGLGRTGKFSAHEWEGVTPDIMTLAKSLGGGLPLGACLATEKVAAAFAPGNHASTFGGNPVSCAAGVAVVKAVSDIALLSNVLEMGKILKSSLEQMAKRFDFIQAVRGLGLMVGIEVDFEAKELVRLCLEKGMLTTLAGPMVLRLLPPLNVSLPEMHQALAILEDVFRQIKQGK